MTNRNILVVDDEKNIVDVVKSYLEKSGYLYAPTARRS